MSMEWEELAGIKWAKEMGVRTGEWWEEEKNNS